MSTAKWRADPDARALQRRVATGLHASVGALHGRAAAPIPAPDGASQLKKALSRAHRKRDGTEHSKNQSTIMGRILAAEVEILTMTLEALQAFCWVASPPRSAPSRCADFVGLNLAAYRSLCRAQRGAGRFTYAVLALTTGLAVALCARDGGAIRFTSRESCSCWDSG